MPPHKEDGACTIENVVAVVEQAEDTQPVDQLLTSSLVVDKDADCILLAVTVILLIDSSPKEVSHGCPPHRHILSLWYTHSQACFTREKSDRPTAGR